MQKANHATNKRFPARFLPANCAEISKVTSSGRKLDFVGLGNFRSDSVRSEIQLLYSFMKYEYEKLISPSFREFYKLSIDI